MASMSRKSSFSAPGTVKLDHVVPPSVVLRTVPLVPLAQTTRSLTALTPRSRAPLPVESGVQWKGGWTCIRPTDRNSMTSRMRMMWRPLLTQAPA